MTALYCWDCGADMVPMAGIMTHDRMQCTGCGLSSPLDITERMNVRRAGEIADLRRGTPCIVCGAPILQGIGHDEGCMLDDGRHAATYARCGRCGTLQGGDCQCRSSKARA